MCVDYLTNSCKSGMQCRMAHLSYELRKQDSPIDDYVTMMKEKHPNLKFFIDQKIRQEQKGATQVDNSKEVTRVLQSQDTEKVVTELNDKSTNVTGKSTTSNIIYIQSPLYKTVLCSENQAKQQCPRGVNCNFAHDKDELRLGSDPLESCIKLMEKKHPKLIFVATDKTKHNIANFNEQKFVSKNTNHSEQEKTKVKSDKQLKQERH